MNIALLTENIRPFKDQLADLFKLLDAGSSNDLQMANELIEQIKTPKEELFDQCGVDNYGKLVRSQKLKGNSTTEPIINSLIANQLSMAPAGSRGAEIRNNITNLYLPLSKPVLIDGFSELKDFSLYLGPNFKADNLSWLGSFPNLKKFSIDHSVSLNPNELPILNSLNGLKMPNLTSLSLRAPGLVDISALNDALNLVEIRFSACRDLRDLKPISNLLKIEKLEILTCPEIDDLSPLKNLINIKSLTIQYSNSVHSLAPTGEFPLLERLDLNGNASLTDLDFSCELPKLLEAVVGGEDLLFINGLRKAPSLTKLHIHNFKLDSIEPLDGCTALEKLGLSSIDIAPLRKISSLRSLWLNLSLNDVPVDLTHLSELKSLTSLEFIGPSPSAKNQVSYEWLGGLAALMNLKIKQAKALIDLNFSKSLSELQSIEINKCDKLVNISGLEKHPTLNSIHLRDCNGVGDLTALSTIPNLSSIKIEDCEGIKDLEPLAALSTLKTLTLQGLSPRIKGLKKLKENKNLNIEKF